MHIYIHIYIYLFIYIYIGTVYKSFLCICIAFRHEASGYSLDTDKCTL